MEDTGNTDLVATNATRATSNSTDAPLGCIVLCNDNVASTTKPATRSALGKAWDYIKNKIGTHAGQLSYAFHLPANATLAYAGYTTQNHFMTASGILLGGLDILTVVNSRRETHDGQTNDPQDTTPILTRIVDPKNHPMEVANFWGGIVAYGAMFLGGLARGGNVVGSIPGLDWCGAANTAGIVVMLVPEKEEATERYHINIPKVPKLINTALEGTINWKPIKAVLDFTVKHPAATATFIAIPAFANTVYESLKDVQFQVQDLPTSQKIYIGFMALSWATYLFVQKRRIKPEDFTQADAGIIKKLQEHALNDNAPLPDMPEPGSDCEHDTLEM